MCSRAVSFLPSVLLQERGLVCTSAHMRGLFLVWILATDMVRVASGVVCVDLHCCLFKFEPLPTSCLLDSLCTSIWHPIVLTQFEKCHRVIERRRVLIRLPTVMLASRTLNIQYQLLSPTYRPDVDRPVGWRQIQM